MTKKDIQQIIDRGWDSRRAKLKEKSKKNSERTKKWKNREALEREQKENLRRFRHYVASRIESVEVSGDQEEPKSEK